SAASSYHESSSFSVEDSVSPSPASAVGKALTSNTARAVCSMSYPPGRASSGTTTCMDILTGCDKSSTGNFTVLVSPLSLTTSTGTLGALSDFTISALVTVN